MNWIYNFNNFNVASGKYFIYLVVKTTGLDDNIPQETTNISVKKFIIDIDYDEDSLASALGSLSIEFIDVSDGSLLYNRVFSPLVDYTGTYIVVENTNGLVYKGYIDESNITYDYRFKVLGINFKPRTYILNNTDIWANGYCQHSLLGWNDNNVNPVENNADNYHSNLINLIHNIFKIVNPDCTLNVVDNNWLLGNSASNCINDIYDVYVRNYFVLGLYGSDAEWDFGNGFGISPGEPATFMDLLKQLCFDFGLVAGMIGENKVVIFEIASYNSSISISEDIIISHELACENYSPGKLTLQQANSSYVWATIINPDIKTATDSEDISKTVFGDIYYKKLSANNYDRLSYAKLYNDSNDGVLIREYFLASYWSNILFNKNKKYIHRIKINGIYDISLGISVSIGGILYAVNKLSINYVDNYTELTVNPL